ncbi:MAG: hypothetical protein NTW29_00580 [Bacteroidetes bacterium]|nr:hypothetical protein [Bacteroidota bacterium]
MKKISICVIALLTVVSVQAQTKKGDKLVGVSFGSISYTNSDSKTSYSNTPTVYKSDGNSFSISVNPNVAWFIKDRLAIGGGVSISFYNSKSTSSNTSTPATTTYEYKEPSIYIGPLLRYYFSGSAKGMPFAQFNFQYGIYGGKSTSKSGSSSSETKTKPKGDWNTGITFGYEHFITPNIGFYGSLGFNYGKSKTTYEYRPSTGTGYDYTSEYSRFYIPVNVGLQVHILGKKK